MAIGGTSDGISTRAPAPVPSRARAAPPALPSIEFTAYSDRDRHAHVERIIELTRWMILIVAAVTNNFPNHGNQYTAAINLLLASWGGFNLATTLALVGHHLPGRFNQAASVVLDLAVASAVVYLSGGINSNLEIAFYVVIISGSLRFGLPGAIASATMISAVYIAIDAYIGGAVSYRLDELIGSKLFLFYVVAIVSGLLARELIASRAKQAEHTFELEHAAFQEMREVDRIKSDFMMLASHELRTPLTKIKAWVTLMQTLGDGMSAQAHEEGLHELRTEAEQLARLTDNLLCIAQLESGEIRLRTTTVLVDSIIRDVLGRFVETADRNRFVCAIDPDAQEVIADPDRLALVLACLVDNALKFSPVTERVQIDVHRDARMVRLEVHDSGRRIPDSEVDRIFASFYQVEAPLTRQRQGSGVGLYLARQLAERMGGKVWIDNAAPRGNTFVVALPTNV